MNELTLSQLERLLERTEQSETPEDVSHRYALRRALLNSPSFERNRFRIVWTRLFMYTTSVVAGGAVVAVLMVSVMTVEIDPAESFVEVTEQPAVELADADPTQLTDSDPSSPRAYFASFDETSSVRQVLEFARPAMEFAVSSR